MRIRPIQVLAWFSLLGLVLSQSQLAGAERRLTGREIFNRECAKCHGRNGQGIKGKYDEPLHGDRPLDKLTRYIEKSMPDDDPGKVVGEDATAVARYIYDAFYSREARLRNNPPRVELVRLTNRQYVNTVADLISHFTESDSVRPNQSEHGLRAVYYSAKDFNGDKKVIERVDRQVDFDYGERTPDAEHFPTNQFSMQWRGSVIADESGEYEFVLKTPNGARLWVNNDDEPLIDAWVASGKLDEHKATLRLVGGRVYPLRLDYFKFKDKTAAISLQWKPPHGALLPIPARNLSSARTTRTFVVSTPFPPDDSSVGYERGVSVSKAWDEAATYAAIETANHVVKHLDGLSRSKPADTNRAAKVEAFCIEFVEAAFRQPLTEEQKRVHVLTHFNKALKPEDSVKRVVLLTLKSPRFLYLGLEGSRPGDFEVATRLSFGLWDSLPDRELRKLAAQGELKTSEQVARQARRMLGDPRARAKMQYFLQQWLQMNRSENLSKDDKTYPGFTPEIIADLRTSLNLFLEDAVWNGSSDYRKLLLADYVFLNDRLAKFYGVDAKVVTPSPPSTPLSKGAVGEGGGLEGGEGHKMTDDFVKVPFDPKQRSGVVTHPYLLAEFSYQKLTSPIHRGVFLTRNIVGRALRSPPMAMTFKDADFAPNLTMREKVAELTRPQDCQGCHSVINPLGFSLENYDAVGRFRTDENGRPIDVLSDYLTEDGKTVRFAGARDVAEFAAGSEQAQNAFIEQLFNQVVKQPMLAYGSDTSARLRRSFAASDFNMQKLLVEMATISAVHGTEKGVAVAGERKSTIKDGQK